MQHDPYEQFAANARNYGVELTRVSPAEVPDAVSTAVEGAAVGTTPPWENVELPETVQTEPTVGELEEATTGVTAASLAIAEYGSLVLQMDREGSEAKSLFTDRHVALLREEDIVEDMSSAFDALGEQLRESRGSAIIATGPSATADMGALVQGAHGPKEVSVITVS